MSSPERRPLSPAQRQTAAELPWYRTWLHRPDEPKPRSTRPLPSTLPRLMRSSPATLRSNKVPVLPEPPVDLSFLRLTVRQLARLRRSERDPPLAIRRSPQPRERPRRSPPPPAT